jgi:hypothetical protein
VRDRERAQTHSGYYCGTDPIGGSPRGIDRSGSSEVFAVSSDSEGDRT